MEILYKTLVRSWKSLPREAVDVPLLKNMGFGNFGHACIIPHEFFFICIPRSVQINMLMGLSESLCYLGQNLQLTKDVEQTLWSSSTY